MSTIPNEQTDGEGSDPDVQPFKEPSALDRSLALHPAQYGTPGLFDAKVLTAPPMSCNPAAVTGHKLYDAEQDAAVCEPAVQALTALQAAAVKVLEARRELADNPTLAEGAKVLAVAEVHAKVTEAAYRKVDAATRSLDAQIGSLQTQLSAPLQTTSSGPLAQEIRAHVRALPIAERMSLVSQAIKDGDTLTASAILACPAPYLTGLTAEMQTALTQQWHRARRPQDVRRLEVLTVARDRIQQAAGHMLRDTDGLIGAKSATVLKLRTRQQNAQRVIGAIAPVA